MKKILIISLLLLLITGCGSNKEVDANKELNKNVLRNVNSTSINTLKEIDKNLLLSSIGLESNDVVDFFGMIPEYTELNEEFYVVIKPKKKHETFVRESLDLYSERVKNGLIEDGRVYDDPKKQLVDNKNIDKINIVENMVKEEYKGYYIYISSKDKDKVLNEIKKVIK